MATKKQPLRRFYERAVRGDIDPDMWSDEDIMAALLGSTAAAVAIADFLSRHPGFWDLPTRERLYALAGIPLVGPARAARFVLQNLLIEQEVRASLGVGRQAPGE